MPMVVLIPAGGNITCSWVEKCAFPSIFPLHLNPGLVFAGFLLTPSCERGRTSSWGGPDPVAFLQVRVFMQQREVAGVRACVRGGRFGKPSVSAQCPATMALSQCPELGETLVSSCFAGTCGSEQGDTVQPAVGKLLTRVGQVSQWLPPHFPSQSHSLERSELPPCSLQGGICISLWLPQPCWWLLEPC